MVAEFVFDRSFVERKFTTLFVGLPLRAISSLAVSRLLREPYWKLPVCLLDHWPLPIPPKSLFVVKLLHVVVLASPKKLNWAEVTSAPNGNVMTPAEPFPWPLKVFVYDVAPPLNCVSVVAEDASGAITEMKKRRTRKTAFRIVYTSTVFHYLHIAYQRIGERSQNSSP